MATFATPDAAPINVNTSPTPDGNTDVVDRDALHLKRSLFVHETGLQSSEIKTFSRDFVNKNVNLLTGRVDTLQKALQRNPHLLDDEAFMAERNLVSMLGKDTYENTEQAVREMIRRPDGSGIILAMEFAAADGFREAGGLGLLEHVDPEMRESLWSKFLKTNKQVPTGDMIRNLTDSAYVYKMIQKSPAHKAYFLEVYGIDVDDKVVSKFNPDELIDNPAIRSSKTRVDPESLREEIYEKLGLVDEFQDTLGIPLDAQFTPEQIMLDSQRQGLKPDSLTARNGLMLYDRALEIFDAEHGGIRDGRGHTMDSGSFNPLRYGYDLEGNYQRMIQARMEAMTETIVTAAMSIQAGQGTEKTLSNLRQKQQAFEQTASAERKKLHEEQKTKAEADKAVVQKDKDALHTYQQGSLELAQARREAEGRTKSHSSSLRDIKLEIIDNDRWFKDKAVGGSYAERLDALQKKSDKFYEDEKGARLKGVTETSRRQQILAEIERETKDKFKLDVEAAQLDPTLDYAGHEAEKKALKKVQTTIETQEQNLQPSAEVVKNVETTLTAMHDAIDVLENTIGVSRRLLETYTVEQMMEEINAWYETTGDGWPPDQNGNPNNRTLVLRAMMEARAQKKEDSMRRPHSEQVRSFTTITNPKVWGLTEHQLRTLSPAEIHDELLRIQKTHTSKGKAPAKFAKLPDNTQITYAIAEAQNRIQVRLDVMDEQVQQFDTQIKDLQNKIDGVSVDAEKKQLEITIDIMARQGKLLGNVNEILSQIKQYAETKQIDPNDPTKMQAEKNPPYQEAYYRWLDYFTGYQNPTDEEKQANPKLQNNEQYYKDLQGRLNPQSLAELLNTHLGLGLTGGDINPDNVFALLGGQGVAGCVAPRITSNTLRIAFMNMINTLGREAAVL